MQRDSALAAARDQAQPAGLRRYSVTVPAAAVSIALTLVVVVASLRLLDAQRAVAADVQRAVAGATALGTAEAAAYRVEALTLRAVVEPRAEDAVAAQQAASDLRAALDGLRTGGSGVEQARVDTLRADADQALAAAEQTRELARRGERDAANRTLSESLRPQMQRLGAGLGEERRRATSATTSTARALANSENAFASLLAAAVAAVVALALSVVVWQHQRQVRRRLIAGAREALARAEHYVGAFLASAQQYATGSAHQAAAIQEMAATTEELSATARYVADSAGKATQLTTGSQAAVNETVAYMEEVQAKVAAAVARITALGEQSQRVGAIADLISDIAGKTHLLSVNAAIEAVTAGQHGRRFGVVAAQVKDLATETQEATAQVKSIVAEIRAATEALVSATREAAQVAEAGAVAAHRAGASMDDVVHVVQTISGVTQQQGGASQEMARTMREVAEVTRQSADVSRQAAAEAQRLKETTDEFARLVGGLERV